MVFRLEFSEPLKRKISAQSEIAIDRLIDEFIFDDGKKLQLRSNVTPNGVFKFLAPDDIVFPFALGNALTEYQKQYEEPEGGLGRGDCYYVAERAYGQKFLPNTRGVMKGVYPTEDPASFHALNFIKLDPIVNHADTFIAFDVTAGYNSDAEQGRYRILAFGAHTLTDLKRMVTLFYGFDREVEVLYRNPDGKFE